MADRIELFPWQRPNAARITEIFNTGGQVAIDASETGTGKTYVALDMLNRTQRPALVICPKIARAGWARVASDMGAADKLLDVINIEQLRTGKTQWWNGKAWTMPTDGIILWDEIHKGCSGPDTKTTQMLALTKAWNIPVLAISATVADSPLKMRGIGFLLGLHDFKKGSFFKWCRSNGCFQSPYHRGLEFTRGASGARHMAKIHKQIADRIVRMRIDDIPEFPKGVIECGLYDISKRSQEEINEILKSMNSELDPGTRLPMVESLRARQRVELLKVPLFVELAKNHLEENKSVVIFVNFRETLQRLNEAFSDQKVSLIYGQPQKDADRQRGIDDFQENKNHICLCMIQAGGVSINLHDVHQVRPRVSLINPSWSAVEVVQALGRIHRTGGTRALQTFVLAANTVEEKVHLSITRKLRNIGTLNDGDLVL